MKGGEFYIAMKQADSWAWATDSLQVTDGIFEVDAWQTAAGPGTCGEEYHWLQE